MKHSEVKEKIQKKYFRRVKTILKFKLIKWAIRSKQ